MAGAAEVTGIFGGDGCAELVVNDVAADAALKLPVRISQAVSDRGTTLFVEYRAMQATHLRGWQQTRALARQPWRRACCPPLFDYRREQRKGRQRDPGNHHHRQHPTPGWRSHRGGIWSHSPRPILM